MLHQKWDSLGSGASGWRAGKSFPKTKVLSYSGFTWREIDRHRDISKHRRENTTFILSSKVNIIYDWHMLFGSCRCPDMHLRLCFLFSGLCAWASIVTSCWETPWPLCNAGLLPRHSLVCSRGRVGCGGRVWVCVPREVFPPDLPRASSCDGPTPGPRCPAGGCNAGAGALRGFGGHKTRRWNDTHVSQKVTNSGI